MEISDPLYHMRRIKTGVDKDLRKALGNFNVFMEKLRQFERILNEESEMVQQYAIGMDEEISSDLQMMKSILLSFNTQCEDIDEFKSSRLFVYDNEWIRYPSYPVPDLMPYSPGTVIQGIVSYVQNSVTGLFYLMDFNRSVGFASVFNLLQTGKHLKRIADPEKLDSGDMVALKIDGEFTRAIVEWNIRDICLFLVDIGEELRYDDEHELYEIADFYKQIPAQALLCQLMELSKKETAEQFLDKYMYETVKMEVICVKYNTIHVRPVLSDMENLISDSTSETSELTSVTTATNYSSTNPFLKDLCEEMKKTSILPETTKPPVNLKQDKSWDDDIGTSNAMVAVLGYDPKDEARYCKNYDEKTGGCFKGASCNFVHQKPLSDGWTRDQVPVYVDIPEKIPVPNVGTEITIQMSFCEDIHLFWGYIKDTPYHRKNAKSLNTFNRDLNRPENMKRYKRFRQLLPAQGELVLAPYGGSYYRARVLHVGEEDVTVFFVDYGNFSDVAISDLYQFEGKFGEIPFQAVKFKIAGVVPFKPEPLERRARQLFKHLENRTLFGIVTATDPLTVRVYDDHNIEIRTDLLLTGYAEPYDNLMLCDKKPDFVPMY